MVSCAPARVLPVPEPCTERVKSHHPEQPHRAGRAGRICAHVGLGPAGDRCLSQLCVGWVAEVRPTAALEEKEEDRMAAMPTAPQGIVRALERLAARGARRRWSMHLLTMLVAAGGSGELCALSLRLREKSGGWCGFVMFCRSWAVWRPGGCPPFRALLRPRRSSGACVSDFARLSGPQEQPPVIRQRCGGFRPRGPPLRRPPGPPLRRPRGWPSGRR